MKKVFILFLSLIFAFSLISCGNNSKAQYPSQEFWYEDGELTVQTDYKYDEKGNVIKETVYYKDEGETELALSYQIEYAYDEKGNLITTYWKDPDENGNLVLSSRFEHKYENNLEVRSESYATFDEGDELILTSYEDTTYDIATLTSHTLYYSISDDPKEFNLVIDTKTKYKDNFEDNVKLEEINEFYSDLNEIDSTSIYTYYYNEDGTYIGVDSNSGDYSYMITYTYDENGNILTETEFDHDLESDEYTIDSVTNYLYDKDSKLISEYTTYGDESFPRLRKYIHEYDKNGNEIKETSYDFNVDTRLYEESFRIEYVY